MSYAVPNNVAINSLSASSYVSSSYFYGDGSNISNLSASQIFNWNSDVRDVFIAGDNVTINQIGNKYAISSSGGTGISTIYVGGNVTGSGTSLDPLGTTLNPTFTTVTSSYYTGSSMKLDYIDFNETAPAFNPGRLHYDSVFQELILDLSNNDQTSLNIGQQLILKVKNNTGTTISKGKIVRISGSQGSSDLLYAVTASWENDGFSAETLGFLMSELTQSEVGYALLGGMLFGVDTSGYPAGVQLYLSSSGNFTSIKPVQPNHSVRVGYVAREQAINGSIFVRIQNGYELDELHDVLINSPQNYDLLVRDTDGLWKNTKTLSGSYTITSVTGSFSGSFYGSGSFTTASADYLYAKKALIGASSSLDVSGVSGSLFVGDYPVGSVVPITTKTPIANVVETKLVAGGSGSSTIVAINSRDYASAYMASNFDQVYFGGYNRSTQGTVLRTNFTNGGSDASISIESDRRVLMNPRIIMGPDSSNYYYSTAVPYDAVLHVTGSSRDGATNMAAAILAASSSAGTASVRISQYGAGDALIVEDETRPDTSPFIIKNDGKVGIGLTDPITKLQITSGSGEAKRLLMIGTGFNTSSGDTTLVTSREIAQFSGPAYSFLTFNHEINSSSITPVPKLFIGNDAANQFAIGTSTNNRLNVYHNNDIKLRFENGGYTLFTANKVLVSNDTVYSPQPNYFTDTNFGTPAANLGRFNVYTSADEYAMTIASSASVTSASLRISNYGTGDSLLIEDETRPDTTPFVVKADGKVGIGITSPNAKLEVIGNISASQGITGSFNGDGSGLINVPSSLILTTDGLSGSATLVGNTLNVPKYVGLVPVLSSTEVFRGATYRNNLTTFDTYGGLTISATGTPTAQSVASTNYQTKQIRMKYAATVTSSGRYTGVRDGNLWYLGGGFRYVCGFGVTDTTYASGCRQFYGMSTSSVDLTYNDVTTVDSLTNIIGIGSDAADTNLQVFYNDGTGTASKIDLGSNFLANRTALAAMSTIYYVELYNPPNSSLVLYKVTNGELNVSTEGTLTTNLPSSTLALNCFASRCMGGGGGLNNTGEFCLTRFGVYSI